MWRRVQAINVEPIIHFAKAFVPGMAAAGRGRIVTTGLAITLSPEVRDLAYISSKGSVHGVTKALANELGDKGITVDALAPTAMNTGGFAERRRTRCLCAQPVRRSANGECSNVQKSGFQPTDSVREAWLSPRLAQTV